MPLDLIQTATDGFAFGVPAQGVFEPEIDVAAQFEASVEVGPLFLYEKC